MAEYIKREDAINVINQRIKNDLITGWLNRIIYTVPDADVVEVRHGQWIKCDMDIAPHSLHCTKCWWSNHHIQNRQISIMNFCPNCGARMDKEE